MKLYRVWAMIERDMRKFFRSPALMMSSMIFPLVQLMVLGYAFGGEIKGSVIAVVDMDHSVVSRQVQEMFAGIETGPQTFRVVQYDSVPQAVHDLRAGFVDGVVEIPMDFSRRFYRGDRPRLVFIEDNTDQFLSNTDPAARPGDGGQSEHCRTVHAAPGCASGAQYRRAVSLHRIHQVSAGRIDCHVDFHRGHDRRRHHVHR